MMRHDMSADNIETTIRPRDGAFYICVADALVPGRYSEDQAPDWVTANAVADVHRAAIRLERSFT